MSSSSQLPLHELEPTYEVGFLEHDEEYVLKRRWVSVAVSGFRKGTSRYEQVEKILGSLGTPVFAGGFSMRRMREAEVRELRENNRQIGGTPIADVHDADGLTARIAYPEEGEDLDRVLDPRIISTADALNAIEMVQRGDIPRFGNVTPENADKLASEARCRFEPLIAG